MLNSYCALVTAVQTSALPILRSKGLQERTRGGSGHSEICVEAMSEGSRTRLRDHLADTWDIEAKLINSGEAKKAVLQFPTAEPRKLHALVAPFIHPSLHYKLLPEFQERFAVEPVFVPAR